MGDIPPPTALYPQPPAPSQNLLSGDPGKLVGTLNALQDYRLRGQQFDALAQQPAAALQGQNIQNQTAQMKQNEESAQIVAHRIGSLPDNATKEDIYKAKAAISAIHPNISAETINTVGNIALSDPQGLRNGLATLRLLGVPASDQLSRVTGPPTVGGAPTTVTQSQAARAPVMQTGLSPKEQAAQTTGGSVAADAANRERVRSLNYQQEVFPLEQAIPALEKLGPTGTGPGTETLNHVKSFLLSAGVPGIDVDKIKKFDETKKYLTDFVNQNGNTGTNDKLAAAFAGNPSVGISNAAATDVAKSALALRRFKQAQQMAFDKSDKSDEDYPKEASKWAREHDPRVYGFDMMTVPQRNKVLESLPTGKDGRPGPREHFMMDVQEAMDSGIIKRPPVK